MNHMHLRRPFRFLLALVVAYVGGQMINPCMFSYGSLHNKSRYVLQAAGSIETFTVDCDCNKYWDEGPGQCFGGAYCDPVPYGCFLFSTCNNLMDDPYEGGYVQQGRRPVVSGLPATLPGIMVSRN